MILCTQIFSNDHVGYVMLYFGNLIIYLNRQTKIELKRIKRLLMSLNALLHICGSKEKHTSFIFVFSLFTCRYPSDVFTSISPVQTSSLAVKHWRLDFSVERNGYWKNENDWFRVWLSIHRGSIKSTDFHHNLHVYIE